MSLFSFLLPQPLGLLPFLVAGQPWFHLLLVQVDWDAGPTDDANVKANLRGTLGLGKWASIFVIVGFSLAPPDVAASYPS
nr:hypothetical protein [Tanacetum cinerariifolium]